MIFHGCMPDVGGFSWISWIFHGFLGFFIRCRENMENVSTTDSDRGRLVSSLRVRTEGDEVQFEKKDVVYRKNVYHKLYMRVTFKALRGHFEVTLRRSTSNFMCDACVMHTCTGLVGPKRGKVKTRLGFKTFLKGSQEPRVI